MNDYINSTGPAPEHAVCSIEEDGFTAELPVMLMVCGFHRTTQGAHDWLAAGGGLHVGPVCDIDGCGGEQK